MEYEVPDGVNLEEFYQEKYREVKRIWNMHLYNMVYNMSYHMLCSMSLNILYSISQNKVYDTLCRLLWDILYNTLDNISYYTLTMVNDGRPWMTLVTNG